MKKPNYTKGPWNVEKETTANGITHISIRGEPDTHLFTGVQICKINYHLDFKNDLANAHLIAAAPEMYEALGSVYCNCHTLYPCEPGCFMLKIESVLKKSRGEL